MCVKSLCPEPSSLPPCYLIHALSHPISLFLNILCFLSSLAILSTCFFNPSYFFCVILLCPTQCADPLLLLLLLLHSTSTHQNDYLYGTHSKNHLQSAGRWPLILSRSSVFSRHSLTPSSFFLSIGRTSLLPYSLSPLSPVTYPPYFLFSAHLLPSRPALIFCFPHSRPRLFVAHIFLVFVSSERNMNGWLMLVNNC